MHNASTQAEFTEIFNAVRTGTKLTTGLFSVLSQNAIIVRGSVDTMYLVEKILSDLDRPKAEVVVDVVIMSVNRTKMTTLGASLLGAGGLTLPLNFTPRQSITAPATGDGTTTPSTGTASNAITLAQASRLSTSDYSTTFPSAVIQALLNDATTRILQRPQVRATDGGKSALLIGSQIPIVSGSLNSAVATPGAIPYATTQFQQVSVGTAIEFAPHVNGPEDISMHVKVDISNVLQRIQIAGIEQPIIGKQTDEADIRMKDGEVSILGGLTDKELNNTLSGVPGLTSLPVLNYIFGTRVKTNTDNEILLVLIPHIIRAPDQVQNADLGIYSGSERVIRVNRKSDSATPAVPSSAQPAVGAPPVVAPPGAKSPLSNTPGSTPGPATAPGIPGVKVSPNSNPPTPPPSPGGPPRQ